MVETAEPRYPRPRLRPLGLGDVIDEAARLYLRHFRQFVEIGLIVFGPFSILTALPDLLFEAGEFSGARFLLGLASTLLWIPAIWLVLAAITVAMVDAVAGRRPEPRRIYRQILRRFWPYLGLVGLVSLVLVLGAATIVGLPFVIYLFGAWSISHVVVLSEQSGIFGALGRSRRLVRGHWWRVFALSIVLYLLYSILNGLFSIPAATLGVLVVLLELEGFLAAALRVLSFLFSAAGQVLVLPLYFGAYVLIYYDLRVRHEALDLERQAVELGLLPAAA